MIDWKKVDKDNPPDGKFIFFHDDEVYTGWIIDREEDGILLDHEGFPMWENAEGPAIECANVRYYAEYNRPNKLS